MNESPANDQDAPADPSAGLSVPNPDGGAEQPRVDTARLISDYDAVKCDVFWAQALASDFQGQPESKTTESAHLKRLLQATQEHLAELHRDIFVLREERHELSNVAMQLPALQNKFDLLAKERDVVQAELESVRAALEKTTTERIESQQNYEQQIAKLVTEIKRLQETARDLKPK